LGVAARREGEAGAERLRSMDGCSVRFKHALSNAGQNKNGAVSRAVFFVQPR